MTDQSRIDVNSPPWIWVNSFHMVVAQQTGDNRLSVVDRIKVNVRLAGGLNDAGILNADAQQKALDCYRSENASKIFPKNASEP